MSYRICQSPVAHSWGILNHQNGFHGGMFKLNATFDTDLLLYLLSHFEDFLKRFYLFIFRQWGREKERERNINVWLPFELLARNPGICPDWESNWLPVCSQASTQFTEPYQPGLFGVVVFLKILFIYF